MSLINNALKRAQEQKDGRLGPLDSQMQPVDDVPRPGKTRAAVLVCVGLLVVGCAAWYTFKNKSGAAPSVAQATPQPAKLVNPPARVAAKAAPAAQPAKPAAKSPDGQAPYGQVARSAAAGKAGSNNAGATTTRPPSGLLALLKSLLLPDQSDADNSQARNAQARSNGATASKGTSPRDIRPAPYGQAAPAPAARKNAAPAVNPRLAALSAAKVDPSKFKLSGIMLGAEATAVVNGQFVRVGQTVDDAKVVRIGRYSVELEYQGERYTLRM